MFLCIFFNSVFYDFLRNKWKLKSKAALNGPSYPSAWFEEIPVGPENTEYLCNTVLYTKRRAQMRIQCKLHHDCLQGFIRGSYQGVSCAWLLIGMSLALEIRKKCYAEESGMPCKHTILNVQQLKWETGALQQLICLGKTWQFTISPQVHHLIYMDSSRNISSLRFSGLSDWI